MYLIDTNIIAEARRAIGGSLAETRGSGDLFSKRTDAGRNCQRCGDEATQGFGGRA